MIRDALAARFRRRNPAAHNLRGFGVVRFTYEEVNFHQARFLAPYPKEVSILTSWRMVC